MFYFLDTSGDETETAFIYCYNNNSNSSNKNGRIVGMFLFRNAEKDFEIVGFYAISRICGHVITRY